ncbi:MAG: hypothetical protein AAF813_12930, partial [Pseudomonadota bacterium]
MASGARLVGWLAAQFDLLRRELFTKHPLVTATTLPDTYLLGPSVVRMVCTASFGVMFAALSTIGLVDGWADETTLWRTTLVALIPISLGIA